jgi:hypothetical protein
MERLELLISEGLKLIKELDRKFDPEIWKIIKDYDNYEVSNFGSVRNLTTKNKLSGFITKKGYPELVLRKNGVQKHFLIHRLVADAFLKKKKSTNYVDHIDGNKLNNNVVNLRWCTSQENVRNTCISVRNTSGVKGVFYQKACQRWCAQIKVNRRSIHIGYYKTIEEAKEARQTRAKELFGEFTNKCEF